MALAADEKFGPEYIAITDPTISLALTNGLDEKQTPYQTNKITEMNDKLMKKHYSSHLLNSFRILSAAEVNIMKDGSLDIANNVLDRLDIV